MHDATRSTNLPSTSVRTTERAPLSALEAIYTRRAVRAYEPTRVAKSAIDMLLRAAVHAPSAMNTQPWIFSIVQSRSVLERYSERAKKLVLERTDDPKVAVNLEILRDPAFNIFYDAGTLVVIGVSKRTRWSEADGWLAAENLMLAACDAGLGTCCVGFAIDLLNQLDVKAELGIPVEGAAIAPIILGAPRGPATSVLRAEPNIVSWIR